jgi:hypothetical protein
MLHVYADESCKEAHKYLILGAIAVEKDLLPSILADLQAIRKRHKKENSEVKWSKCRSGNLRFYQEYVQVFFDRAAKDELHFHCMYVDTSTYKHHIYNMGSAEVGFSKLIYQLLLHKFGRKYGAEHALFVFLDHRESKDDPEALRPMLNSDLHKRWDIRSRPFRRLQFRKSEKEELIQLTDLLIGAIGFRKNRKHKSPDAAKHKCEFADYIRKAVISLEPYPELASAKRFTLWPFKFKG